MMGDIAQVPWIEYFLYPSNSYVDVLTPSMIASGDGASGGY
jgi:hypothetical protein